MTNSHLQVRDQRAGAAGRLHHERPGPTGRIQPARHGCGGAGYVRDQRPGTAGGIYHQRSGSNGSVWAGCHHRKATATLFWTISRELLCSNPTRAVGYATSYLSSLDAHWCVHSDGVPDSRLQATATAPAYTAQQTVAYAAQAAATATAQTYVAQPTSLPVTPGAPVEVAKL